MKDIAQTDNLSSSSSVKLFDFKRPNVALFLSGNLAAETMALVHTELTHSLNCEIRPLTDGTLYTPACDAVAPREVDPATPDAWLAGADLLITSIRSPGHVERQCIRAARRLGIPTLVILSDLGSGATKFRDQAGWALPDVLAVTDQITWSNLASAGISEDILYPLGSPYLDNMCTRTLPVAATPNRITFFDLPNSDDFVNQGRLPLYTERELARDFTESMSELGDVFPVIRPHPKQRTDPTYHATAFSRTTGIPYDSRETLEECIGASQVVVSSYSTCLLLAHQLGRHAISYQPNAGDAAVRRDLYLAARIPIATSKRELTNILKRMLIESPPPAYVAHFLFNAGRSLNALSLLVEKMLYEGSLR